MRELDVLLTRFLDREYAGLDEAGRTVFQALLRRPDPELASWVLGRSEPADPPTAALVQRLKRLRERD